MKFTALRTIWWLACKEWVRAWSIEAAGGRDFLYLSLMFGLIIALGVLGMSFGQGVLSTFADSFLGRVNTAGFPILAETNPIRPTQIDRDIIGLFGPQRHHDPKIQIP